MYLQESNQGKTAPRTALRCHEGKALPGCLWHFSTIFYSIKKSILKIAVPPNLKFCFLEISWRKTTINYRIMWEEMTSSTAINFLWMKSFGVREGFGPGLADGSWLLFVSTRVPKEDFQNNSVNWRWENPCYKRKCCNRTRVCETRWVKHFVCPP